MPHTFQYTKKYSVSNEIEFVSVADTNFDVAYSVPEVLIDLQADNLKAIDNLFVDAYLTDQFGNTGNPGDVLIADVNGVYWGNVGSASTPILAIDIYDEGVEQGLANRLDFYDGNDQNNLVSAAVSETSRVATITISDRWALSGNNIYRDSNVGINTQFPQTSLDVIGNVRITEGAEVIGLSTFKDDLIIEKDLEVLGIATLASNFTVSGISTFYAEVGIGSNFTVSGISTIGPLRVIGRADFDNEVGINSGLSVGGISTFNQRIEVRSTLQDINDSVGPTNKDYRLSSVGTGVSWRPAGVETENTIWVTMDGDDANTGLLEGDAKRTIGAAAEIAQPGDTIFIRSGTYTENNPIGLRSDVSVTGQDLRLVNLIPDNKGLDFFHVRRGCLVENLSFTCESDGFGGFVDNPGGAAVAFPPTSVTEQANSGFIGLGPTFEGETGRWRSPYVRNCTNFMPKSIGMKINGDHASASIPGSGADLKSMVCDSFTQYNEAGIGVSITNSGYAQLVSIFTINSNIGIYCDTGGSCDLTNSNTSFGNFGLYAVGLGRTEFTATVSQATTDQTDTVILTNTIDTFGQYKRPYDGQALFFKINTVAGILTAPLQLVSSVTIPSGAFGSINQFSATAPPSVLLVDATNGSTTPLGPEGITAEVSPTIDPISGRLVAIDIINSGRNYLPTQVENMRVQINGTIIDPSLIKVNMEPIYYTVSEATEPDGSGTTTVTFNEFVPYLIDAGVDVDIKRISRILTSSHSFEYVGAGTSINTVTPLQGAVPIKENEIVALAGAQIPFTSTDQKGNFAIGEGFQINQPTSTIRGRSFSKAIQAELTPLILALSSSAR